jgi:nucleoside-diphosphate-sugar epimerase
MKRIFVTGHKGYIGAHLVGLIKAEGWHVTGCDLGYFEGCEWSPQSPPDRELTRDIRDLSEDDLAGHDCVMHLAAISNDPMGELDEELTVSTNRDSTIRLAQIAKAAGVPRFLFSSSCSIYGQGASLELDETASPKPVSTYARSKVEAEQALSILADEDFSPAYLRNATAFGDSPMLRIDLVANHLLACAVTTGEIRIISDGAPWRPLIHCKDIARAFVAFAQGPRSLIHDQAVNIGGNSENYQIRAVANAVQQLVPEARIVYTGELGADCRSYRVNFDKLARVVPNFRLEYNLSKGLEELHERFLDFGFSANDFNGPQFVRLRTLKQRLLTA